jgi:hypothetical protein
MAQPLCAAGWLKYAVLCLRVVQADAAREARRGAAAQISELEVRAAADKANLER